MRRFMVIAAAGVLALGAGMFAMGSQQDKAPANSGCPRVDCPQKDCPKADCPNKDCPNKDCPNAGQCPGNGKGPGARQGKGPGGGQGKGPGNGQGRGRCGR